MTSKADFNKKWAKKQPIERRARLNELAAQGYLSLDADQQREHDELATLVAEDEEVTQDE